VNIGQEAHALSAESIRTFGFLERSVGRDPEEHPADAPALVELLREWRAAERGLAELKPGSIAWVDRQVEIERLRQRYQDAFDAMHRRDEGSPTP
jgi:hypothetical protein